MNLNELVEQVMSVKKGDKEFALVFERSSWYAVIGNTTQWMGINDINAEYKAYANNPERAVWLLIKEVIVGQNDGVRSYPPKILPLNDDTLEFVWMEDEDLGVKNMRSGEIVRYMDWLSIKDDIKTNVPK